MGMCDDWLYKDTIYVTGGQLVSIEDTLSWCRRKKVYGYAICPKEWRVETDGKCLWNGDEGYRGYSDCNLIVIAIREEDMEMRGVLDRMKDEDIGQILKRGVMDWYGYNWARDFLDNIWVRGKKY